MPKTAVLRARVDEATLERFDAIVEAGVGDRSDHLRAAVIEYIRRHQDKSKWAQAAHLDDHEPLGVIPS